MYNKKIYNLLKTMILWYVTKVFASMINYYPDLFDRFATPPYVTSLSTATK